MVWCIIVSFERLYDELSGSLRGKSLTLDVFNHIFTLVVNFDHYIIRKRTNEIEVFDSKNTNI
jgi:hypothetical protein